MKKIDIQYGSCYTLDRDTHPDFAWVSPDFFRNQGRQAKDSNKLKKILKGFFGTKRT